MATTTPNTLVQDSLNIAVALQANILNGQYVDLYVCVMDLCAAVIALADAAYGNLGTTGVAVVPTIGNQYQTTTTGQYPSTQPAAVFTRIR